MRPLFGAVGIPLMIVAVILLSKAGFDWLEARSGHGSSEKAERQE